MEYVSKAFVNRNLLNLLYELNFRQSTSKVDLTYFPSPKSPILMRTICVSSLETVVSCRISIVCPDSDLPRITNVTSCDAIIILKLKHQSNNAIGILIRRKIM